MFDGSRSGLVYHTINQQDHSFLPFPSLLSSMTEIKDAKPGSSPTKGTPEGQNNSQRSEATGPGDSEGPSRSAESKGLEGNKSGMCQRLVLVTDVTRRHTQENLKQQGDKGNKLSSGLNQVE
ncbi:MAG: hypothetical protein NXY57DRAFT_968001 [Lentinula lateritia]|nr:MAG: hypothetical protein NXY57DRAFT_968001 [Lentinula lateritia]